MDSLTPVAEADSDASPPPKRILIVDEDNSFRLGLHSTLESLGYSVTQANNAKTAKYFLTVEPFDAVFADVRIADMNGIELLHYIKKTKTTPVVLMSGFSDFKSEQEALDIGATDLLNKPFKMDRLKLALMRCFECNSEDQKEKSDAEDRISMDTLYCKIDMNDFISSEELKYDLFIRLSNEKYVKIAHKGEIIPKDRLESYQKRNIRYLHMRKEDFKDYVGFSVNLAKVVRRTTTISKMKRLSLIKHASDVVISQLYLEGVNEESFDNAKNIVETTVDLISDSSELTTMVQLLNKYTDHLYAHSLGVALHSTMIAKALNWNSHLVIFKLNMGGILHDIGKREIPPEILEKPRIELTPAEVKILESHTIRGAEILSRLPFVPTDVVQIAAQHHENILGLGFPAGLKGKYIHPLARLVAVANEFCNMALKGPHNEPMSPTDAIQKMAIVMSETVDATFFSALVKLYSVQLSIEQEEALKRRRKLESIS